MNFFSELKKPFNIITLFLAIIGIILSIIFYYNGKKKKEISYLLNQPTSLIFDSRNSTPKLKLYEQDSIPVTGDVYLLTGTVWNSGDFPITSEDLRLPIALELSESNRILDFKIIKQKDSSVANFILQKVNRSLLEVGWKYFDPNFGFAFQIIYVGGNDPEFNLKGKVLDITNFTKVEKIENVRTTSLDWALLIGGPILVIIILIIQFLERRRTGKFDKFLLLMAILLAACLLVLFWLQFFHKTVTPI